VKCILSLSHGNSDVERRFSDSSNILSEERANMSLRMLNARIHVKYGLKFYDNKHYSVPITKELLSLAHYALSNYKEYLDDQRKQKEEHRVAKEKEILLQKNKEELKNKKDKINKLNNEIAKIENKEAEERTVVKKLFEEAHKKT
jgi:hypothetical protein